MNIDPTRIALLFLVLTPPWVAGCGEAVPPNPNAQGGSTTSGAGGSGAGGASAGTGGTSAGTGGDSGSPTGGVATGGSSGTSAGMATGGSASGSGGSAGSGQGGAGGTPVMGGQSGSSMDGGAPQAGMSGRGGSGGRGGAGAGAGGTAGASDGGSGGCTKGQTEPSEVILIGDSFIALNHSITNQIESRARGAGALGQNEDYRDVAVSGATLAGSNQIPSQYTNAVRTSPVKVVLMDGGGNDCIRNDPTGAFNAATALFQTMGQNETETVVYFFYPDPVGSNWASLKSCLDTLRPQMKALCDGLTQPKCYFMDLRTVWQPSYALTDGIHPTEQGGQAVGDAVWATMQQFCVAQ